MSPSTSCLFLGLVRQLRPILGPEEKSDALRSHWVLRGRSPEARVNIFLEKVGPAAALAVMDSNNPCDNVARQQLTTPAQALAAVAWIERRYGLPETSRAVARDARPAAPGADAGKAWTAARIALAMNRLRPQSILPEARIRDALSGAMKVVESATARATAGWSGVAGAAAAVPLFRAPMGAPVGAALDSASSMLDPMERAIMLATCTLWAEERTAGKRRGPLAEPVSSTT